MKWYSGFLQSLERKFPEIYDRVVHKYLKMDHMTTNHGRAVRVLLGVGKNGINKFHLSNIDLFEKINHPNATFRAEAIRFLFGNFASLEEHQRDLISVLLPARLKDDHPKVTSPFD